MLTPADLITLPYTPDLTQAGILYACRSLPHTYNRMGGSGLERLRRIVAGKAVELAFLRHLHAGQVPHDRRGITAFTDPDHYDLAVGGRPCDLKSYQLFYKDMIRRVHRDPALLLGASALVPTDQVRSARLDEGDLYVFAFSTALVTRQWGDVRQAIDAGQPLYLIHPMPVEWTQPRQWASLGELALKADIPAPLEVELGGQGADRRFQTEVITLHPHQRAQAHTDFYSLAYLHVLSHPSGPVGVRSPRLAKTYLAEASQWGNIWVYGLKIFLTGYISRDEFRRRSGELPAGSRVFQYPRTRTPNLSLPIRHLHPLDDLFTQAKTWAGT